MYTFWFEEEREQNGYMRVFPEEQWLNNLAFPLSGSAAFSAKGLSLCSQQTWWCLCVGENQAITAPFIWPWCKFAVVNSSHGVINHSRPVSQVRLLFPSLPKMTMSFSVLVRLLFACCLRESNDCRFVSRFRWWWSLFILQANYNRGRRAEG